MNDSESEDVIVPVPGFGFFSNSWLRSFQTLINSVGLNQSSSPKVNQIKCNLIKKLYKIKKSEHSMCPPLWDNISCFPSTLYGTTAVIPCIEFIGSVQFNTSFNATRSCDINGKWAVKSNYSQCRHLQLDDKNNDDVHSDADWSILIYAIGYSVSLVALTAAIFIFLRFRELRCPRNIIHTNLFITYLFSNSSWITFAFIQYFWLSPKILTTLCVNIFLLRYFHLTTFFWMFIEGLYLFLQVIFPMQALEVKLRHYYIIGWAIPALVMWPWSIASYWRHYNDDEDSETKNQQEMKSRFSNSGFKFTGNEEHSRINQTGSMLPDSNLSNNINLDSVSKPMCFLFHVDNNIEWLYKIPVLLLLAFNAIFLISIMTVVIRKIRDDVQDDGRHYNQHWKAARALLMIIPLLGITYLLTIVGPSGVVGYLIFQNIRAVLLATQGFFVTLPYCFLNTEVGNILKHHWRQHRLLTNEDRVSLPLININRHKLSCGRTPK